MYEAVHAHPDGDATVARHAATAERYGYEGIVVRTREALDPASKSSEHADEATALRDEYGIDVVDAVEIDADNATSASGAVGNYRSDRTVVCVVGGDDGLNRFAVEEPRVDVLVRPMGGGDFNHVLAKAARDNGVHVEFDLGPLFRATGGKRVRALADLRKLREIVTYYDTPHVVSANPRSHLDLRAPRARSSPPPRRSGSTPSGSERGFGRGGRSRPANRAPPRGLHRAGGPTWQV